jgi:hypothetical protein
VSLTSTPAPGESIEPLGKRDFVISADEKTSIQLRIRCNPTLTPASTRAMRVEHEYDGGGSLAYLAARDVHRAKVFGRCEPRRASNPSAGWSTR